MSLSPDLWAALGLERGVVRERAQFFRAYAESASLFDPANLIRALRDGPIATGGEAVVSYYDPVSQSGPNAELQRRISDSGERSQYADWVRIAERADALRQSAMAELLYSTSTGSRTLLRCAEEYRRLGLPFGSLLMSAMGASGGAALEAGRRLRSLVMAEDSLELGESGAIPIQQALAAPAQEVAVLLTALSRTESIYQLPVNTEELAAAAQAGGLAPVGTTGQPLALWWECGRHLYELAFDAWRARDRLRTLLTDFANAHGAALRNAQYDYFHWSAAVSRVDLVDFDLACLVAISARVLRQLREAPWDMLQDFPTLSALAQVSIRIGLDLSEQGGGEVPDLEPRRPRPGPASEQELDGDRVAHRPTSGPHRSA